MLIQRKINGTTFAFQLTSSELAAAAEEFTRSNKLQPQSEMAQRLRDAVHASQGQSKGEHPHEQISR